MKKVHLLVNLKSGSDKGAKALKEIEAALKKEKLAYNIQISTYPGQLVPIATKTANEINNNHECIVVVGGDGSLNQALNGVKSSLHPDTPLAYFPAGTGNDFARAAKLQNNPLKFIKKIKNHPTVTNVDCGRYQDLLTGEEKYFVNNLGIGFDAFVVNKTNHSKLKTKFNKINIGNLTYGINIAQALKKQDNFKVKILTNEHTYSYDHAYLVTTTNHPYFGGGVPILPIANIYNHKLDIAIVEKPNLAKFLYLFSKLLLNGSHMQSKQFHYFEANKIEVETYQAEYGQLDGEELNRRKFHLKFEVDHFKLLK
ncbi:YegS/Rv2252/BmrU family lipid kinase [Lactobacillus paragasseri]|uniref:diacylglycerol/lipid kinase family protein n=1 Tax=Lactobacillus paragasseri TaxID=2107999 RepID=UPI0012E315CC|nr:YegS/Rv2252/BmrU family lipid kinase [Lactobacillus paragasseri]MDK8086697.1 YegS/Rv2252/BmrU family lipid kinase [Lactobacillus paragasseri]MDX5118769.1 YegS/Rv2252/BmrU family lipid kinase [Lactobacillus paragasseri]MDX5122395.1 YegS/Rv2252/BmrU family lipid kinase [Lactobacillus paragasseri]QGT97902.1 YegS/Rv2252/BmrU family lipid kinase [Lactobacillus paragasseri]UWI47327.1 YegS/Rv2252/BmrU family lipid kinase [Lactobacillus paragasseri]